MRSQAEPGNEMCFVGFQLGAQLGVVRQREDYGDIAEQERRGGCGGRIAFAGVGECVRGYWTGEVLLRAEETEERGQREPGVPQAQADASEQHDAETEKAAMIGDGHAAEADHGGQAG